MKQFITALAVVCAFIASPVTASAQQTTGNITGRIVDDQGSAVPGVTVTGRNTQTGFTRTDVSDAEGIYRLSAMPVGTYDISAELQGFSRIENKNIVVNVGQVLDINMTLKVASVQETVTVTGETPLIETSSSSVGGVVDVARIENLPLNGRQFANLAATVPGVGLGFHSDPTKSTQYSPQINGGAGRNVNYQIDGGDNNDDTVGGLLQLFPLEAIQEFNFVTQRFKAEYGRSNGGVLNVVTKSGTNNWAGSFFEMFRDKSMNAITQTEKLAGVEKSDYRRNQFGGSFGGPILRDKAHFFFAAERTLQDTKQAVDTQGLFSSLDGVYDVPYRENLLTGKVTTAVGARHYLAVRYGRNNNSQPYGAGPTNTPDNWGDSENKFNSINLNHNWVLGGSKLNEFIFQYADFRNHIGARSSAPNETFPNGVTTGANVNTPQTTEQKKWQFKNDFSFSRTGGGGIGHDFKVGVNYINEPRLFITFNTGRGAIFTTHLTDEVNGPISEVTVSDGDASANIPTKQFGAYFQDDWRVTDRFTVNLGLRWDLVTGYQLDQSLNPNFVAVQNAARAGLLTGIVGLENFAEEPRNDYDNYQPRIGGVYDLTGEGKQIIRAGWGIYTDFGYTNSNVLFAAADSTGRGFGQVFNVTNPDGIRNPDGSFYQAGQSLDLITSQNQVVTGAFPLFGQWVDPRLELPYTRQTNVGYSHEVMNNTVLTVDYVRSDGRDLNFRPRVNQLIPGTTTRRLAALVPTLTPNTNGNRPAISRGRSQYDGLILSARRRLSSGLDYTVSYTLSRGKSTIGNATDELNTANIQDPNNPFDDPRQFGPNLTTDARHRITASAVIQVPRIGVTVSPFFVYRSALPVALIDGRDLNLDGDATEIPTTAFRAASYDADTNTSELEEIGPCETVNCGRLFPQSQFNLRVSKSFRLRGNMRVEAIGEIFNLFNALNPSNDTTTNRRVTIPSGDQAGQRDPNLLQPSTFSGDFQRPEQRVGQIGFRFSF
jgi:outer membrane receptor protein involved in Fe transport